jgi:hypothetical protein
MSYFQRKLNINIISHQFFVKCLTDQQYSYTVHGTDLPGGFVADSLSAVMFLQIPKIKVKKMHMREYMGVTIFYRTTRGKNDTNASLNPLLLPDIHSEPVLLHVTI